MIKINFKTIRQIFGAILLLYSGYSVGFSVSRLYPKFTDYHTESDYWFYIVYAILFAGMGAIYASGAPLTKEVKDDEEIENFPQDEPSKQKS